MRSLTLIASLCLAATAAAAGPNLVDSKKNITLSNGCVYTPSPSGTANTWALVYASTGPAATCAFQVKTQAAFASRDQAATLSIVSSSTDAISSDYVVGVFR